LTASGSGSCRRSTVGRTELSNLFSRHVPSARITLRSGAQPPQSLFIAATTGPRSARSATGRQIPLIVVNYSPKTENGEIMLYRQPWILLYVAVG
jgi:hypothetical protein